MATKQQHHGGGRLTPIRITDMQVRIYKLLREGAAQSLAADTANIRRDTVSRIARKLVEREYLERVTDTKPYLYGDGLRSRELDDYLAGKRALESTTSDVASDGRGVHVAGSNAVRQLTPKGYGIGLINAHHIKLRFRVIKIGDMHTLLIDKGQHAVEVPLLDKDPYLNHNNVVKYKGKLHFDGEDYSIELEDTPTVTWFYVYMPARNLTVPESKEYEQIYLSQAQQVANFLQKHGKWEFGIIEFCPLWKPHFAACDDRLLNQLVGKVKAKSHSGKVWLSDSEGRREIETSEAELATVIADMPEFVLKLNVRMDVLLQILEKLVAADEKLAQLQVSRLEKETVDHLIGGRT